MVPLALGFGGIQLEEKPVITRAWSAKASFRYRIVIESEVGFDPLRIEYDAEFKRQLNKSGAEPVDEVRAFMRNLQMKTGKVSARKSGLIGESFGPFKPNEELLPAVAGLKIEDPLLLLPVHYLPRKFGVNEFELKQTDDKPCPGRASLWKNQDGEFVVDGRLLFPSTTTDSFNYQAAFDAKGVLRMASVVGKSAGMTYRATITRR